ncbi:MAG: hypothetical protein HC852_17075 [Acaryochloridaceae cyanobacterium RU_4_10]|nr:hypothetical protein [Acaryochloridaceae cyanobacterium RU_4_10]
MAPKHRSGLLKWLRILISKQSWSLLTRNLRSPNVTDSIVQPGNEQDAIAFPLKLEYAALLIPGMNLGLNAWSLVLNHLAFQQRRSLFRVGVYRQTTTD